MKASAAGKEEYLEGDEKLEKGGGGGGEDEVGLEEKDGRRRTWKREKRR